MNVWRKIKSEQRSRKRAQLLDSGKRVTENDIIQSIESQGIQKGDHLMIHSSFSSLGYVENGPPTLIHALMKLVSPSGNILMPSFPAIGFNYDYLKKQPVFNVLQTPSKMGVVSEMFRQMPEVKRSLHPTDPVCVWGPDADWYIQNHGEQPTPYNAFSPFKKLIEKNGKIVLIGVKLESVTNFHTIEDEIEDFPIPVYHQEEFECKLVDEKGTALMLKTKVHNPAISKKRKCNELESDFLAQGVMKKFVLGEASCAIISAKHMHNRLMELYQSGITIYNPPKN